MIAVITDQQLERYARHVILDEVGEEGQEKLLASRVMVVGAGGLGAPAKRTCSTPTRCLSHSTITNTVTSSRTS